MRWLMTMGKIASYLLLVPLLLAGAGLLTLSFPCPGAVGPAIRLIGLLQVLAVCYFWPRQAYRPQTWAQMYRYPQRPTGPRRGATLASTLVAMFLITICLTMLLQAYVHGSRARQVQAQRTVALAACQERIEMLRVGSYAALPAPGEDSFPVQTDASLQGTVRVAPGPVAASKEVTVTVQWPGDERMPAGRVSLSTIISARGMSG